MKKHLWAVCYGIALAAFTVYIALDTFVISSTYQTNATQENTSMFADNGENTGEKTTTPAADDPANNLGNTQPTTVPGKDTQPTPTPAKDAQPTPTPAKDAQPTPTPGKDTQPTPTPTQASSEPVVTAYSYEDSEIKITITEYYEYKTKIYVADVELNSAQHLKTAFAKGTYGKNVVAKTSATAAANNAILAINGDYYGARSRGYVIRNGIVYRRTASTDDLLCIYADGSMKIQKQADCSADDLVNSGVWQAFAFGPGLISDGSITVTTKTEVGRAMASNPRTAVGMISENHYLFVVADGRTGESAGLTLYELALFMQSLGAKTAYNLDGGGSSTMWFNGKIINKPTTNGRISEREVSDIVYIK